MIGNLYSTQVMAAYMDLVGQKYWILSSLEYCISLPRWVTTFLASNGCPQSILVMLYLFYESITLRYSHFMVLSVQVNYAGLHSCYALS